jgi:choline dehydrogenase-like flavoprotein
MDHVMGGGARGTLPVLKGIPDPRAHRPNGIYIPRFRNIEDRHPDFLRGYGFQGSASEEKWGHAFKLPGFGASFKHQVRERPWRMSLGGFAECLAQFENFCELDKEKVDAWGIPVLRISASFGDNERRLVKDAADTACEMLEAAGAAEIERREEISLPGLAIHEVGTARMGKDPKTSVVNRWQQCHDVHNLFVMDGSVYPSSACQNPTLTIMALAARACDHLVEQHRRGEL